MHSTEDVPKRLAYFGAWAKALYIVRRAGVDDVKATVIIGEAARGVAFSYQYLVGICYLAIGLFIYFRRGSASAGAAFLYFLPRFVHLLLFPLHRETEPVRSGDRLGQPDCRMAGAGSVSALQPDLPGTALLVPEVDGPARFTCPARFLCWWRPVLRQGFCSRPAIRCLKSATRSTASGWAC